MKFILTEVTSGTGNSFRTSINSSYFRKKYIYAIGALLRLKTIRKAG